LAAPAPPQVFGEVQVPQFSVPPQPSPMSPQLAGPPGTVVQVYGVQPVLPH